jgi:hypothetical protein
MSIEVGDAVLRFIGDSTQLDTKFDEVEPNAAKAFNPAAEVVEEAGQRMQFSMKEARGEVRLLGEEFGVHLPRHVSNFLAELPGVGPAMATAFSATAILFVAQALAQATDKLSNFVGNTLIFTEGMRKSNEEVEATNKSLVTLAGIYNKAKERLDELNGSTKSQEDAERALAQQTVEQAKAQLASMEATIANKSGWDKAKDTMKDVAGTILGQVIPGYYRLTSATQDQIAVQEKQASVALITSQALRATNEVNAEEAAKNAKAAIDNSLRELEEHKKIALSYAKDDQEKYELDQEYEEKKLALLNSYAVKDKAAIQALMNEIETQQQQHADKISAAFVKMLQMVSEAQSHAAEMVKDSTLANIISLTPLEAALQKAENAAHAMGITLRTDLVMALEKAKDAEQAFAASGIVDKTTMEALQKATADAQHALDNYGHSVDTFKLKSHGMWAEFQREAKDGAKSMDLVRQSAVTAFDDVSKNIQSAFSAIVLGQGNVVKELEKATAASLAQIASQAAVKAIFYTAEGVAAAVTPGLQGTAAGYFLAAAEMAGIAVVAGAAGHELAGAGGGSGSGSSAQSATSNSNTGQSNRSGGGGVSGVQMFASGGLVTGPTLGILGEERNAPTEAVLPLDDPEAMGKIREGIGSGTTHHWHIDGMISSDNLAKVMQKMSKLVGKGQATLTASNSLRITKRSA